MMHNDICELDDQKAIISCLKERFEDHAIYTYVGRVLIAINPFKTIKKLYSEELIKSYHDDTDDLPPHLYSIANRIIRRINLDRPQAIIFTGVSGSGKTKSASHIITFLGHSDRLGQRISSASAIFELFGNAATCLNENSSRFSKLTEVYFNPDQTLASVKFSYILLESNRVYARNQNESNFHILYAMKSAMGDLCNKLKLNITKEYAYLSGSNNISPSLDVVDRLLNSAGMSYEERIQIYSNLAAIIHLGNIVFAENVPEEKIQISDQSINHFENVARLLEIDKQQLEKALLTRTIEVKGDPIAINLSLSRANKSKQTLAKVLYERIFQNVVSIINEDDLDFSSLKHLSMLDIAGFESFETNRFEQMCINFVNEKVQQMFVKTMLRDEQEWYAQECLEVPTIPFFDNNRILDIFENKLKGIFKLLDDTCKIQCQNSVNFIENMFISWPNDPSLTTPKPKQTQQNAGFIIRHFAGDVFYNADNFIEKNLDIVPKEINEICQNVYMQTLSSNSLHNRTATFTMKMETAKLISKFDQTECSFVHCIKPNTKQCADIFNENFVLSQLSSTGCIAYQKLIRTGFPFHMKIDDILSQFKQNQVFSEYASKNQKNCCGTLIRSCSLKWNDYRFGNTNVFFRNGKFEILANKLKDDLQVIINRFKGLEMLRAKWRIVIIAARFCTIGRRYKTAACIANQFVIPSLAPRVGPSASKNSKKRKIDKKIAECSSTKSTMDYSDYVHKNKVCRTTITIPSNENRTPQTISTENQLRNLLRLECEKNKQLSRDFHELQERNLNLIASLDTMKKENQRLVEENEKLHTEKISEKNLQKIRVPAPAPITVQLARNSIKCKQKEVQHIKYIVKYDDPSKH